MTRRGIPLPNALKIRQRHNREGSQYSYLKCSKCAFGHIKLINQESLKAVGCLWAVGDAINGHLM